MNPFHYIEMMWWPQTSAWYAFWSSVGGLGILSGVALMFRHINCHQARCWRLGKHPVKNTPIKTCRKHNPDLPNGPLKAEHIHRLHREANR